MKYQVRRCFDRAHATYRQAAVVQREIAAQCLQLVPADRDYPTVLEIGAGGGVLTRPALAGLEVQRYIACDISKAMLQNLPCRSEVRTVQGDGEALPMATPCVDLLLSASTMQWYTAPERALPENLSLLRPGGRFALAVFVRGTLPELRAASEATGFGATQPLVSASTYRHIVARSAAIHWHSRVQTHIQWHDSVADFLRSHKKTGATFSPGAKHYLGKNRFRQFCAEYAARFGCQGKIPARYRVLYIWGCRHCR